MTIRDLFAAVSLSLGASLLTAQAHALAITDVSVQNSGGGYDNASAAAQGLKKPKTSVINSLDGLFAGDAWTVLDDTRKPSKTFNGVDFTLTADKKKHSGAWGLDWNDPDLAQYMDFVLVLKGGKQWAAYLFEAGSIGTSSMTADGLFEMTLVKNKNGKTARLRRATIFGRMADLPIDGTDSSVVVLPPGSGTPGSNFVTPGSGSGTDGSAGGTPGSDGSTQGSGGGTQGSGVITGGPTGSGNLAVVTNPMPAPGSLALVVLSLALCGMQLRKKSVI